MNTFIYWCDKCGKRFSCEPSEDALGEAGTIFCESCTAAKRPRRTSGQTVVRTRVSQVSMPPAKPTSERTRTTARSAPSTRSTHEPNPTGRKGARTMVFFAAGGVPLLVILLFAFGGSKTAPSEQKKPQTAFAPANTAILHAPETATPSPVPNAIASVPSPTPATSGTPLDAERLARNAFDELDTKLKSMPESEREKKKTLCEAFLKDHGSTILAARVRTFISDLDGPAPVQPVKDGRTVANLGVMNFEGGQLYPDFQGKGVTGRAIWGIRTDTHALKASLKVTVVPTGVLALQIRSLRHEPTTPATIRISLNGTIVHEGPDKNTEQEWRVSSYELPDGLVRSGDNALEIVCTEDSDAKGRSPWFMVNEMMLTTKPVNARLPNVHVSDLKAVKATNGYNGVQNDGCCWNGEPLRLTGVVYAKGLGAHSPSEVVYELAPEYKRFVARLGFHDRDGQAGKGSVIGRVLVDGQVVKETPVFRGGDPDVDFDVELRAGNKQIALVIDNAGDGSDWDLVDWVNAGFLTE